MNPPFDTMMRQVRSLVSSGRLSEATAAIQEQLAGGAAPKAAEDQGKPHSKQIDLEVVRKGGGGRRKASGPLPEQTSRAQRPQEARAGSTKPATRQRAGGSASGLAAKLFAALPAGLGAARKPPVEIPAGARFLALEHSGPEGARPYKLYVPAALPQGPRSLVVMLHGCTQGPDDFAAGTRMNQLAEEFGLLVAYPEQLRAANPQSCWNWFKPSDQQHGGGEPAIIAGIVAEISRDFSVDRNRVFAAGLSAGGAMAAIMGAEYPDLFAAIGIHSGLPAGAARNVVSAMDAMRGGAKTPALRDRSEASAKSAPMIVFHGDADATVHPSNGEQIAMRPHGLMVGARPEVEEGLAGGRRFRRTRLSATADAPQTEFWQIDGLGHAWSGGSSNGSYADPAGPDASREMLRFFMETTPQPA